MRILRFFLNALLFATICCQMTSCQHSRREIPVFYNEKEGVRFGYEDGKVQFIDCVQIDDESATESIWLGDYTFTDKTLPIGRDGDNSLILGRPRGYTTNNWQNETASKFDRYCNTSSSIAQVFAIRAHYLGYFPERIVINLRFPNNGDLDIVSSQLVFEGFLPHKSFLYIWFFPKDGESVEDVKRDFFADIDSEASTIPFSFQANIYLSNDYDPINDDDDVVRRCKEMYYKYWTGSFYSFEKNSPLYISRLDFGLCLDEPYPFAD